VADEMTLADVQIGLAPQAETVPKGSALDLMVGGVTIRVTEQTDMRLLVQVMRALADARA
jgi:hypothetical protein